MVVPIGDTVSDIFCVLYCPVLSYSGHYSTNETTAQVDIGRHYLGYICNDMVVICTK
jgi:hypothetical protein